MHLPKFEVETEIFEKEQVTACETIKNTVFTGQQELCLLAAHAFSESEGRLSCGLALSHAKLLVSLRTPDSYVFVTVRLLPSTQHCDTTIQEIETERRSYPRTLESAIVDYCESLWPSFLKFGTSIQRFRCNSQRTFDRNQIRGKTHNSYLRFRGNSASNPKVKHDLRNLVLFVLLDLGSWAITMSTRGRSRVDQTAGRNFYEWKPVKQYHSIANCKKILKSRGIRIPGISRFKDRRQLNDMVRRHDFRRMVTAEAAVPKSSIVSRTHRLD